MPIDSREWNSLVEQARNVDMVWLAERYGAKLVKDGPSGLELVGGCPVCNAGTDRFSIRPRDKLFNCRVCGRGGRGPIDLLMFLAGIEFAPAVRQLTGTLSGELRSRSPEDIGREQQRQQSAAGHEKLQHDIARKIWHTASSPPGTIVEKYLHARGYHFPIPETVRFLPSNGKYPDAMVSAFALPSTDRPGELGPPRDVKAIHLTALLEDGSDRQRAKGAKRIIGKTLARPIAVSPIGDDRLLCISEGIEDALAFCAAGFGSWAAGSAPHMVALAQTIPDYIVRLIIARHDDDDGHKYSARLVDAIREQERQGVRPRHPMDIQFYGDGQ
jgi:CHC2 zinc finger